MSAGAISLLLICALFAQGPAQRSTSGDELSPEAEAEWKVRDEAIKKEIEKLGAHPWAGSYYFGDGLGANVSLTVAPDSGFAHQWAGCLGVYGKSFGGIAQTERGIIKLRPKYKGEGSAFLDKELVPVSWGQRRYLIRLDRLAQFCDAVQSGREPRHEMHGGHYLREGDHEKPVAGEPVFPEPFHQTCEDLVKRSNPNDALAGFLAAFERLEWDKFRSYIAEDACVIHPSAENPARLCGRAEVEASFQKVFEQIRQSSSGPVFMELRPERLNIQMLGADAAITSFELTNEERFGRRTLVWQKQETGAWKIVHLHASSMTKNP